MKTVNLSSSAVTEEKDDVLKELYNLQAWKLLTVYLITKICKYITVLPVSSIASQFATHL